MDHTGNLRLLARVGACEQTLLDTEATTNLVRSEVAINLGDKTDIRLYKDHLEAADGRGFKVDGCITSILKTGGIDDDIETLVIPGLKNQMILGLRSMKEYRVCLVFWS